MSAARREGGGWSVELRDSASGEALERARQGARQRRGPWVEEVLRRTGRNAENRVRLVKGSHIVVRKFWEGEQAYLLQNDDKRVIFVNPYEGDLCLIGTTDIPFDGKAEDVAIAPDEIDYLLAVGQSLFRDRAEARRRPALLFRRASALRRQGGQPKRGDARLCLRRRRARRRRRPLLSVFGGKITTYRKLAEHALGKARRRFFPRWARPGRRRPRCRAAICRAAISTPVLADLRRRYPWLPPDVAKGYGRRYGTRGEELLTRRHVDRRSRASFRRSLL